LYEHTPFKHPQIDFKKQCLVLINAPSDGAPVIKNISYDKKSFIIDVEYSEFVSWDMGICGTAILIDRPETTIKLSEKSLSQHERLYGNKLRCIINSLNHIVDKDVMDTWNKIVIKMFNDISRLKRHFRELKNFDENSVYRNPETNEIIGIGCSNKRNFLVIEIEHPLKTPIQLGAITGPAYTYRIWEEEYGNICVTVEARMRTNNRKLKKEILEIIKKRIAPLDKLNNGAN
jgi:hypothetical protein